MYVYTNVYKEGGVRVLFINCFSKLKKKYFKRNKNKCYLAKERHNFMIVGESFKRIFT